MVWVSPGMFDTKVMVAPNSPIALAKPSTMPASTPGSASGKRHGREHPPGRGAQRARGLFQPAVDRLDRQPDRPHQQRKRHHAAGQRRAGPAKREHDAEMVGEPGADQAAPAEGQQQQIAGDDRRQHQRQMDQRIEQRLAPEIPPRQQPRDGDAERRRHQRRDRWRPAAKAGSPSIRSARCRTRASGRRADQEGEAVFLENGLGRRRAQEGEIVGGFRLSRSWSPRPDR